MLRAAVYLCSPSRSATAQVRQALEIESVSGATCRDGRREARFSGLAGAEKHHRGEGAQPSAQEVLKADPVDFSHPYISNIVCLFCNIEIPPARRR